MPDFSQGLPIAVLLVPYGLFALLYVFFVSFNVYHLWRYGTADWKTELILFVYLAGTVLIGYGSFWLLSGFDWNAPIDLQKIFGPLISPSLPEL